MSSSARRGCLPVDRHPNSVGDSDLRHSGPADILRPRKRRHFPRVDAKELPTLQCAIDAYVGGGHTRLALKLMSLTFVRTSELIGARWPEFDMDASRWHIPAERWCFRMT